MNGDIPSIKIRTTNELQLTTSQTRQLGRVPSITKPKSCPVTFPDSHECIPSSLRQRPWLFSSEELIATISRRRCQGHRGSSSLHCAWSRKAFLYGFSLWVNLWSAALVSALPTSLSLFTTIFLVHAVQIWLDIWTFWLMVHQTSSSKYLKSKSIIFVIFDRIDLCEGWMLLGD